MVGKSGVKKEVSDLSLVAYLQIKGYRFSTSLTAPSRVVFVFDSTEKLEKDVLLFLNRTAKVDALSFSEALRGIKNLAFRVMEAKTGQRI